MAKLDFFLDVQTTIPEIEAKITQCVSETINSRFDIAIPNIKKKINIEIAKSIRASETFQELVNKGPLQGELGVINPVPALDEMIARVEATTDIRFQRLRTIGTGGLRGKVSFRFINENIDEYITQSASFVSQPSGETVDWMEWLLKRGDEIIVRNYEYQTPHPRSRTDQGIMKKLPSGWRVPTDHSGLPTNNFITRAIDEDFDRIVAIISKELQRA